MAGTPGWTPPDPGAARPAGPAPQGSSLPPPGPRTGAQAPAGAGAPQAGWQGAWQPPARPGVVPLRPLGIGEILDGAVTYIRRYPRPTLGIAAGVALVLLLLQAFWFALAVPSMSFEEAVATEGSGDGTQVTLDLLTLVQGLVQQVVVLVATGLLTYVMGQAVLGRDVTTRQAWQRVRPRVGALIGLGLLSLLAITAAALLPFVPGVLLLLVGAPVPGGVALVLGLPLAAVAVVWVYLNLVLAPSALVLERIGVVASIRRSRTLLRDGFWRTFGVLLLAFVISGLVGALVGFFVAVVAGVVGGLTLGADAALIGGLGGFTLGSVLAAVVTIPFDAGIRSLLYVDRRVRREGFDLTLARAAGAVPGTTPPPPPPTHEQRW